MSRVLAVVIVVGCSHGNARSADPPAPPATEAARDVRHHGVGPAEPGAHGEPALKPPTSGTCDRAVVDRVFEANIDLEHRGAAAIAAEACPMSGELRQALIGIAGRDCLEGLRHIDRMLDLLARTCPRGFGSGSFDRSIAGLVEHCELDRLGFATREQLEQSHHPGCLLLGSMLYVELEPTGEPHAAALARELAINPAETAREERLREHFEREAAEQARTLTGPDDVDELDETAAGAPAPPPPPPPPKKKTR
jgi:hypothetical protein